MPHNEPVSGPSEAKPIEPTLRFRGLSRPPAQPTPRFALRSPHPPVIPPPYQLSSKIDRPLSEQPPSENKQE